MNPTSSSNSAMFWCLANVSSVFSVLNNLFPPVSTPFGSTWRFRWWTTEVELFSSWPPSRSACSAISNSYSASDFTLSVPAPVPNMSGTKWRRYAQRVRAVQLNDCYADPAIMFSIVNYTFPAFYHINLGPQITATRIFPQKIKIFPIFRYFRTP